MLQTTSSVNRLLLSPALRSRNFRLFWSAQVISTMGTFLQFLAERWLIFQLTQSTWMLGLISFISLLPVVPISLLGGLLIDRVPRRKLLIFTQVGLLGQAVVLGVLIWSGRVEVWHIMVLDVVLAALSAVDQPARQAFVTELVSYEELPNAIALNASLFHFARLIGFTASGFLIALIGAAGTVLLNAASYIAPILALLLIQVADTRHETAVKGVGTAVSEGIQTLWHNTTLLATMSLVVVVGGLSWQVYGMMPAFAEQVLQVGPAGLGILLGLGGAGALIGTIGVGRIRAEQRKKALLVASVLSGLGMMLFARAHWLITAAFFAMVLGFTTLVVQAISTTLIQLNTPDRLRGRMMSLYSLCNAGAPASLGMVVGWFSETWGLPLVLAVGGGIILLYVVGLFGAAPAMRDSNAPSAPPLQ